MSPPTDCTRIRELVSARLDGEASPQEATALDRHLAGCSSCRTHESTVTALTRRVRLRPVLPVVDLTGRVVSAAHVAALNRPRRSAWSVVRVLLLVVGLLQLLVAAPDLLGTEVPAALHVSHEVGVSDVALAVGVLAAGWQPWRAAGMLPVVLVLALGLAATSALDIAAGRVSALHEAQHLLALADVVLLLLLRRSSRRRPAPAGRLSPDATLTPLPAMFSAPARTA